MSASKEKRRRQELYSSGQLEKNPGEAQRQKSKRKNRTIGILCIVVVVLAATFFGVYSSGFLTRHLTAATVGEHKLSASLYNFFYQDVKQSLFDSLGLTDADTDLTQMPYDDTGKTYADYLQEAVDKTIAQNYALYDAARAENFELPAVEQHMLDTLADSLSESAKNYGYSSAEAFLTSQYGKGSDFETLEQYMTIMQTSNAYSTAYAEALGYTDEEIDAYYQENKAALDTVSYHVYNCAVPTGDVDENGAAIYDADASKAQADTIVAAAANGENAYTEAVAATLDEGADSPTTLKSDQLQSAVSAELAAWLFDEGRQYGDVAAIAAGDSTYNAVFFVDNSEKYNMQTVNVRHILFKAGEEEGDASAAEAKQEADDMLAQFQSGEQTENAFAALAIQYSEDEATSSNGGLMQYMQPGQTVQAFNDWSFDPARQSGDAAVVETEYGAHVMYFAKDNGNYQTSRITYAMRSRDANAWVEEHGGGYSVVAHSSGMMFVNK